MLHSPDANPKPDYHVEWPLYIYNHREWPTLGSNSKPPEVYDSVGEAFTARKKRRTKKLARIAFRDDNPELTAKREKVAQRLKDRDEYLSKVFR